MDWINRLFSSSGFMPHGFCYTWDPYVVWLNGVSDILIALAYYTIPLTLVYFVRRRRDLAFHWMFLCFALFIVACGTTHVIELWTIWHPVYWLAGVIKALTATVSITTAIALIPLVPQALALPSPEALKKANLALQEAQEALRQTNEELEGRVAERTASLAATNEALRESEQRYRLLWENSTDAMVLMNAESVIQFANPAAEEMFGRPSNVNGRRRRWGRMRSCSMSRTGC